MKNLPFALALALICISMFSCGDKAVISPLNEEFKISGISSPSGVSGATVTLYVKNLDCGSLSSVFIGGKEAEILSRSEDSIVAIVPPLPIGSYTFNTQSKDGIKKYISEYDILKVEPLKITKISSTTGYVNSQVVLYGENLNNGLYIEVKFDEQTAEILQRTNDSIIVKVPKLASGSYDINIKTKLKPSIYESKYEVLSIDFSQFKNYEFTGKELKIQYKVTNEWKDFGGINGPTTSSQNQLLLWNIKSTNPINVQNHSNNNYEIAEENISSNHKIINNITFNIDNINSKFSTISLNFYEYSKTKSTDNEYTSIYKLNIDLKDVEFYYNNIDSTLTARLVKDEIILKLSKLYTELSSDNQELTRNRYQKTKYEFAQFYGVNDNAFIEIKFTK